MANQSNSSNGLGIGSVLALIFITLKLCGVITWSWWWVLSPFWIGFAIIAAVFLVAIIIVALKK